MDEIILSCDKHSPPPYLSPSLPPSIWVRAYPAQKEESTSPLNKESQLKAAAMGIIAVERLDLRKLSVSYVDYVVLSFFGDQDMV